MKELSVKELCCSQCSSVLLCLVAAAGSRFGGAGADGRPWELGLGARGRGNRERTGWDGFPQPQLPQLPARRCGWCSQGDAGRDAGGDPGKHDMKSWLEGAHQWKCHQKTRNWYFPCLPSAVRGPEVLFPALKAVILTDRSPALFFSPLEHLSIIPRQRQLCYPN